MRRIRATGDVRPREGEAMDVQAIHTVERMLATWGWDTAPRINGNHRVYTDADGVTVSFSPPHGNNQTAWEGILKDLRKRMEASLEVRRQKRERLAAIAAVNGHGQEGVPVENETVDGPGTWFCKNCKQQKPLGEFQRAAGPVGHLSVCRDCMYELRKAGLARKGLEMGGNLKKPARVLRPGTPAEAKRLAPEPEPQSVTDMAAGIAAIGHAIAAGIQQDVNAVMPEPAPSGFLQVDPRDMQAPPLDVVVVGQLDVIELADLFALAEPDRPQLWVGGEYAVLWDGDGAYVLSTHGEGPQQGLTPELASYILKLLGAPREGKHYY